MSTIAITGASSGIGRATAKHFADRGWRVAATMRSPQKETELTKLENVTVYPLDVTDDGSVTAAADRIIGDLGTVDAVLNDAGYAVNGPFEVATRDQIQRQFDVNVFGLMNVTRAFLPHFRAKKAGLFLNISSIVGRLTTPLFSLYQSSKFAVEGFSESLSYELGQLGIQVKLIEPGTVPTDFYGRSMDFAVPDGLDAYDETIAGLQAVEPGTMGEGSTPEQVAAVIFGAATDGEHRLRYVVGADAEGLVALRADQGDDGYVATIKRMLLS